MSNENFSISDPDRIRVLIVDDATPIRKIVARSLEPEGYDLGFASDGEEAFERLTESFFDLVITDIAMPNMDGIELIKRIADYFPADVIAMTGRIDQYHYDQIVGAGACDFVQKPFTPDDIRLRVKRVLRERQLKEDVLKSHKELAQAQKLESLGRISAGIAHEINTPIQYMSDNMTFIKEGVRDLTGLLGHLKSLCEAPPDKAPTPSVLDRVRSGVDPENLSYLTEELPKAVDQTLEGIQSIKAIIKAMKEFAHPGKKDHVFADVNQCIRNAALISKSEWKYIADFVLELDGTLPQLFCNPGELTQAFLNLIVNASHAVANQLKSSSSPKGKIKIKTRRRDDEVEIAVSDTGTGIPKEIQSKIFNPFFTTKEMGKGTGQGLAIAHSVIVDRHQGKIGFETAPGQGTTFLIRLPLPTSK